MADLPFRWSLENFEPCPEAWIRAVQQSMPGNGAHLPTRAAQVLWQRKLCSLDTVAGFLNPSAYTPMPSSAFGTEMTRAIDRLRQALSQREKVAIWGDFDADGVTSTAVLWDGLGQLFPKHERLIYYIPNRLVESHGLSYSGLDQLKAWGADLIVTCDTGSTNIAEIAYARSLGMDVIVTDHHTLPQEKRDVVALINPRSLEPGHPLATLSGVAVAYKLLEGLYAALESPPPMPLQNLLDLVAIGLIADLVELTGDCRYLAQVGLRQLQTHLQPGTAIARPGVAELLTLCKRTGDRPTDISFGLGPRINAVSRIHGDARFCVELLTSQDQKRCKTLAYEAELANTRRKGLQQEVYEQVIQRVSQIDLATTQCLVLADEQWPTGILGLVAGQVSQQLGRPTVLLRIDPPSEEDVPRLARGSARSVKGLDLYELFAAQSDMLTGFGGHPLAAGLTLPAENVPILTAALNRAVREKLGGDAAAQPTLAIDLTVTVSELGQSLFRELKWLEPYGMGNPVPKLLIRNAWFQKTFHKNLQDQSGRRVKFIKTQFELRDDSSQMGFPGEWWGHYKDELPEGRCDVVVELDHNQYSNYHVKLVDVRPISLATEMPASAIAPAMPLAIALPDTEAALSPLETWRELVGLAKYLARTGTVVSDRALMKRLGLTSTSMALALNALSESGFEVEHLATEELAFHMPEAEGVRDSAIESVKQFLEVVQEEQFRREYFSRVRLTPVTVL